jgi:hypothetical protein
MKILSRCLYFPVILVFYLNCFAEAGPYLAYSLNEAERSIKNSARFRTELMELGDITRLIGIVYDNSKNDLIIVGQIVEGEQKITLDDFVVALRAIVKNKRAPLVSIDKTAETEKTGKQIVHYSGGIENTKYGKDLIEADIILKRMALGDLRAGIWGIESYFDMSAQYWEKTGIEDSVHSRFWFVPSKKDSFVAVKKGVAVVKRLKIDVKTELMGATESGQPDINRSAIRDEIGEKFAITVMENYEDIAPLHAPLKRLDPLFRLAGLSEAIYKWIQGKDIDLSCLEFWLYKYEVRQDNTPYDYPLLVKEKSRERNGKISKMTIEGGIELKPLIIDLKDGVITALRDIVIKSRPDGNALIWRLPLEGWGGSEEVHANINIQETDKRLDPTQRRINMSLTKRFTFTGVYQNPEMNIRSTPLSTGSPQFNFTDRLSPQKYSHNVGGVMLRDVAKIAGDTKVDFASGNFSLIVDGQNARLSPEVYRKFITALWSVYYSQEDPGISIDPIGCFHFDPNDPERDEKIKKCIERYEKKEEKHLVRYIGKVINTDLGRVMREADYLMKKWSVGTEKPNIPGFKNPDEYRGRKTPSVGGSSRFWFVPEDMKFKQGGDMLLFEDGRMTVKTEFMFRNEKGTQADPYNEKFAHFFTENYGQITAQYPVYQELFDYAKMVSLAKYLKEQGIPLFWFLMANKDLVITEDSPGTVDALAKGSDYYKNLYIIGGVNLGFKGNYVYDPQAVTAINEAVSKLPSNISSKTTLSFDKSVTKQYSEPFSFDLGKQSYTVVPQHSLTSGKDRRGIRYQTDLAFKSNGGPGLELVRYFNPKKQDSGEFGKGWHMLIPYRVKPTGGKREFLNALIPEKMAVENLLTGEQEVLTFSTDRYSIAGYVPDKLESSQVVGLFLMSDASFRLADKLGNEFWFNQTGYLTDMRFSRDHRFHFEYLKGMTKAFEKDLYQAMPVGKEKMEFLNVLIPKRMRVVDLINGGSEDLIFSDRGRIAGYIPEDTEKSRFKILALMSNLSYRLLDKDGNEVVLSPSGSFDGMIVSLERPIVKSVSQGKNRVDFQYTIDRSGKIMIASATLSGSEGEKKPTYIVKYQYDDEGRLYSVKGSRSQTAKLNDQPRETLALMR